MESRSIRLDLAGILEFQQNRPPYLLIDEAEEIVPGESVRGYKDLTAKEWFFECHFPGDPNMPGMLQIEALVQLSALMVLTLPGNKGKVAYLTSASDLRFFKKVVPGDRLCLEATMLSWKRGVGRCSGKGTVRGQVVCQAEYSFVLPSVLEEFRPPSKSAAKD